MADRYVLYISEFSRPIEERQYIGLSVMGIDEERGSFVPVQQVKLKTATNTSCVSADGSRLYLLAEESDPAVQKQSGDRVMVLELDKESGKAGDCLTTAPTLTPNPAYVSISPDQNWMMVANHTTHQTVSRVVNRNGKWETALEYDDASVLLYSMDEDGIPGDIEDAVLHHGSGPLKTQTHAHPHCAVFSPDGKYVAVCDKGADTVSLYEICDRKLVLTSRPWYSKPGDEPRFCAWHPTLPFLYVNHEGNVGMDVLKVSEDGELTHVQTIQACPDGFIPHPGVIYEHQGIAMHPSGKFLYSVVRGVDAMAAFCIDQEDGTLSLLQFAPMTKDSWPRCCTLTPDGKWLIAGSREIGELFLYSVGDNGVLNRIDHISHTCGVAYVTANILHS